MLPCLDAGRESAASVEVDGADTLYWDVTARMALIVGKDKAYCGLNATI